MKKRISLIVIGIMLTFGSVLAGVTINLVYNSTVEDNVSVGDTVLYDNGLIITLIEKSDYTLTYEAIEETDIQKHEVTYIYSYEFIDSELNINVSSLSDDIEIVRLESDEATISITFKLNQDKTFSNGDVLSILFYFDGVEPSVNINEASVEELESVGFTNSEAIEINGCSVVFTDLDDLYDYIYINDIHNRFDDMIVNGLITFN